MPKPSKQIAVLVEQTGEDDFLVYTNADEPAKGVNDHCALATRKVHPDWRTGILGWLKQNGFCLHPDSDYQIGAVSYGSFDDFDAEEARL